jgi:hypothetical protein
MRSLRRRRLQRIAGTWSFTDALDHVLKTVQARTESTSESERRELAKSVRVEMLGVTKRHFDLFARDDRVGL